MSYRTRAGIVALVCLAAPAALRAADAAVAPAPETRRADVRETLHGVEVVDPYRWLEDQQSPETRAWIDAQNAHTQALLGHRPDRAALSRRLGELLKVETRGIPSQYGGRYFFTKRAADQDLFVLYVRRGAGGADEVLLDPHRLSADHRTSVNLMEVSEDGTRVVYGVRQGGEDEVTVKLLDVDTRQDVGEALPKARYSGVALSADKSILYYSRLTPQGPRVFRHALGTDPAGDKEIFGGGYGPEKIISAGLSEDRRHLVIVVYHGAAGPKTEVYVQDVAKDGPPAAIVNDVEARFFPDLAGDTLYLHTDWKAPHGRVLAVDLKDPARERWREVVPEGPSILQGLSLSGGLLCLNYLDDVKSKVRVFEPSGKHVRDIEFPTLGTVGGIVGRWDSPEAFFAFSSFHLPTTIYRYDVKAGTRSEWAKLAVPIDPARFELKQVWFASKDGTRVPMFVLHRKGLALDGKNPVLLTGYGGFTASLTPNFSPRAALWAEAGGVYAVANLRGGSEFGEAWHRAGMLENKQNVFDDFIAAGEWLVKNGYTRPERLAISGGSNGGLLVGAVLTQRPDLFGAVVCSYPLLDMVRYHQFLVARYWVPEYGSSEDPQQFKVLHAYSPYHHVTPGGKYPAVLFITGDADTRVAPLHARKMTALLQSATGSGKPVLLHYDTKAGHAGGAPVTKQIEDLTDEMSFLFAQLGVRYAG
ncbi:MAG TPA: prolyl oligopeptidase family serine peptidase [Vicinamibacteria bacterium]